MSKGVKICLAVVIVLFAVSAVLSVIILRPTDKTMVEIVQDNHVLYTLDLGSEEDRSSTNLMSTWRCSTLCCHMLSPSL